MRQRLKSLAAEVEQTRADFLRTELMMGMTFARVAAACGSLSGAAAADLMRRAWRAYAAAARQLPLLGEKRRRPLEKKFKELGRQLGLQESA
jgi:hypothetical protein